MVVVAAVVATRTAVTAAASIVAQGGVGQVVVEEEEALRVACLVPPCLALAAGVAVAAMVAAAEAALAAPHPARVATPAADESTGRGGIKAPASCASCDRNGGKGGGATRWRRRRVPVTTMRAAR